MSTMTTLRLAPARPKPSPAQPPSRHLQPSLAKTKHNPRGKTARTHPVTFPLDRSQARKIYFLKQGSKLPGGGTRRSKL